MNPDEDLLNYYVPATAHRIELFTACSLSLKLRRNGSDNVSAKLNYISVKNRLILEGTIPICLIFVTNTTVDTLCSNMRVLIRTCKNKN